jgi:hypothetical protein
MSDREQVSDVPVHHRGWIAKTAFVLLVLVPAAGLAAAVFWFCLSRGWPLPLAGAVLAVLFLIVDRFAYGTFCQVEFTPHGLLYRGGGVLWRMVRKERVLSWADYLYILTPGIQHWLDVSVVEKAKWDPGRARSDELCWRTLDLAPRYSAYGEFDALARAILIHNPEAKVRYRRRPRRTPAASTERVGHIDVSGDDEFTKRTVAALRLLEQRDPVNYARLQKYIAHIVSVESKFDGLPIDITRLQKYVPRIASVKSKSQGVSIAIDYETATIEVYRKWRLLTWALNWYALSIVGMVSTYMLHHRFKISAHNPKNRTVHVKVAHSAHARSLKRLGGSQADIELLEKRHKKVLSKEREEDAVKRGNTASEYLPGILATGSYRNSGDTRRDLPRRHEDTKTQRHQDGVHPSVVSDSWEFVDGSRAQPSSQERSVKILG